MLKFLSPLILAGQKIMVAGQMLKCKLIALVTGPSVEDILNSGSQAMQDGGSFAGLAGKVDEFGGGGYHVVYKLMVYLVLLAIIVAGGALVISNAQNRESRKNWVVWIAIGALLIFGAGGIVVFLETTGRGLF